jgi:hypothetical protein
MKILLAINSGMTRSLRAWKGILIFWFNSLIMVSFLIVPLKSSLKAAFGNSMATEKLIKGINVDVLGDMGTNWNSIVSSLFSGILVLSLAAILINTFITGGLFDSMKNGSARFTTENFFRTSAKNFWSFVAIWAMLCLIVIFLIVIVIIAPVSIAVNSESAPEGIGLRILAISCSLFLVAVSIIFLVADYARAWQASSAQNSCFRALGFGFSQTFRNFFSSFGLMLIMILFQVLLGWVVIKIITGYTPVTAGGVFLLFIISQLLFLLKIFLKALRYGSVTSMMEQNYTKVTVKTGNPEKSDNRTDGDLISEFKTETNVR